MEKTYNPETIETECYTRWEQQGYFLPQSGGKPYCIMIPPPNVTGTLHMGHAFQHTLMDALIRYHRMRGDNTLWQPGTDHAGIATQMVVERQLNQAGQSRHELGRDAFLEKVWDWKAQSGNTITQQMRRLGDSPDWSREHFTMDPELSKAVTEAFVRLYQEGLIYRGKRLVNWDPVLLTAISDLEVVSAEEEGHLWHMRYPLLGSDDYLVVATTRPETMLGDVAVAVHPEDKRYKHLIGQQVQLPFANRYIPIIADAYVDPAFGSGCVKITPAHDFNDYAIAQRHGLPLINIFTPSATLNDQVPPRYQGLDRYAARRKIIHELQTANLLEQIDSHKLMVPRGDRSNAVIEPYLTDQWFVKADVLAKPAIAAVESGQIRFVPENWSKTYFNWLQNIEDWCISRQLWWGHRIPAWYDEQGNIYVGHTEAAVREQHQLSDTIALTQDNDVLDTWFSSALWPFSTLGWPDNTVELKTFYPTNVLVTGFDIIFFWVARMIMFGLKFMDAVPFREVYITGLIRDEHGQKMSKSKGNILDPLDLMDGITLPDLLAKRTQGLMQPEMADKIAANTREQFPDGIPGYGADALRFTLASLASTGRDIRFDMQRMQGYRNFCNKLWNASRFVLMNTAEYDCGLQPNTIIKLSVADQWIISRLQRLEASIAEHFAEYRFDLAANDIYDFTWNEYCDWYLELVKPVLQDDSTAEAIKCGARRTLVRVLEALLRIAHPLIPFITEALWLQIAPLAGKSGASIMLQPFPVADSDKYATAAEQTVAWLKAVIGGIRQLRAEMNLSPAKKLSILLQQGNQQDREWLELYQPLIEKMAKLDGIAWLSENATPPESATVLVNELQILLPLAGLIDKAAELQRLEKNLQKLAKEQDQLKQKLDNPGFVEKAPAAVVAAQRERLTEIERSIIQLQAQFERIQAL